MSGQQQDEFIEMIEEYIHNNPSSASIFQNIMYQVTVWLNKYSP